MFPVHSFLDPTYTLTVPSNYTAYGVVDLVAHCLEAWFGEGEATLSDRIVISVIREAMEYGPALLQDLECYRLRAKIMWAATVALNDTTIHGRISGDWGVHALGHTLSFLYDTPHGATLSIIFPAWMRVTRKKTGDRIIQLGKALFGTDDIEGTVQGFETFFSSLGSPIRCRETGMDISRKKEILDLMNRDNAGGIHYPLSPGEREEIVELAW
jgi:alcohol dehydrogenase YqhD (iron-dependent ADH family)